MENFPERDCTSKCRSSTHAKQIFSCIPTSTASQIRAYSVWLCHNFPMITDDLGRNLLHIAAACGKWEIVEWLLKYCHVEIDAKDYESGWTALHRSVFYGQLASLRILCMHGASLKLNDHEGFSPLDIALKDRLPYLEYHPSNPSEVYVWGSNFNYNLGLGNLQSREIPEVLEVFRKDFICIKQVQICKFHSVFLSVNGNVYTCGYGHGGRLGQDNEDISLVPSLVKGIGSHPCVQVAAGQDHLLLLLEGGQVWSCGLNLYHQLGHVPPVEKLLIPKPLSLKFLKGKEIIGVRAARFHSVMYTKDCVYTFGLNAGQLGHPKGERTQIYPRQVSALYNEGWNITHVEASDGATVCATSRGDVFVLHEYQIRKIASRQLEIIKLSVVGGHLDSRCDVAGVREGRGLELRVVLLTKSGKVYLWRQTDPYLRRCLFTSQKQLLISDIHINHYSIGMITFDNEGYMGQILPFKGQRSAPPPATVHVPSIFSREGSSGLTVLLDRDDCNFIKVKRLPHIYRGTSITSDSKGRNFAILQSSPKMGLVELPMVSESRLQQNICKLFSETDIKDDFHDIIIKVGKKQFAAHRYILASRSDYFKKQFSNDNYKNGEMTIENMKPEAFEQVLKFLYCNYCDFLTPGYEVKWASEPEAGKKKKSNTKNVKKVNPVILVQEASKRLNVGILAKKLDGVRIVDGKITIVEEMFSPKLNFDRFSLSSLSDVNLLSCDGCVFHCHKCILAARLDYFHSMLSSCWAENSRLDHLTLPISSQVMEAVLEFLYTDNTNKVSASEDTEFVCQVLMISDQLLIPRLKEICEMALVELITLKNSVELLELSYIYNAFQLKRSCMQFICINLAAIIEARGLDLLSHDVIEDLTNYYRDLVPSMSRRKVSFCNRPSEEELQFIEQNFPVTNIFTFEKTKLDVHDNKTKGRRRCSSLRSESKENSSAVKNEINLKTVGKDIVLDILIPDIDDLKFEEKSVGQETIKKSSVVPSEITSNKRGQWVMKPPRAEQTIALDKIMLEEKQKLIPVQKKSSAVDMKPIPHISQKQKKLLETSRSHIESIVPNSPPSCPWAKLPEQSPPSPSFWDAFEKKEFQPSIIKRELQSPTSAGARKDDGTSEENMKDIVISLSDIQKAEEQKLQRAANPKIKPLNLINIEDQ
ncbi:Inhibitor of Bruton tyrosine kinase, partial [Stegodyphus mimosarum]